MLAIAKLVMENGSDVQLHYHGRRYYEDASNPSGYLLFTDPNVNHPEFLIGYKKPDRLVHGRNPSLSLSPKKGGRVIHVDCPGCLAIWEPPYVDRIYPSRIKHFVEYIPFRDLNNQESPDFEERQKF
jgi:hypothetical protein